MSFDCQFSDGYEHPTHLTKMAYTLEPELTNMQFSVSDTKQSDAPKKTNVSAPNKELVEHIVTFAERPLDKSGLKNKLLYF